MKKLILILLVLLSAMLSLFSVSTRFIFADLNQHTEILAGFLPTYTVIGAGFDFSEDEDTSEFQTLVGGGFTQRTMWQDPKTGKVNLSMGNQENPKGVNHGITYDVIQADLIFRYIKGFFDNTLSLQFGLENKFEYNKDSFKADSGINDTLSGYLGPDYSGSIYPDLTGNRMSLGSILNFRIKYALWEDTLVTNDGINTYLDFRYAPGFLNSYPGFGKADYYSISLNFIGAKTLYVCESENFRWFSIVVADRVNLNWTDGSAVPAYAQGSVSLGRKVRGYNTNTYNMQFTAVNNFDIRFSLPPLYLDQIRPRVNLFADVGIAAGNYFNTSWKSSDMTEAPDYWLASVGAQFEMSFWDIVDLGYQIAYIFNGEKFTQPGSFTTGFTFFLDF